MKNVKWKPETDKTYYFINEFLDVEFYNWQSDILDCALYNCGNCFQSREEAEKKAEEIKEILKK